ncbi:MAG TPA: DsbA family protein [Caulobacteraceae bacterium]|jgi:protein-disulfide isomerase
MRVTIVRSLVVAALAGLLLSACSKPSDKPQASREQVLAFLDDHPEVINEAAQRYELKRQKQLMAESAKAIAVRRAAIERDPHDFVANPNGKVTVTEFFDYRCPYCKASLPAIQALILQHPDIRFVFKEYPIIPDADGQIGVSLRASEAAMAAGRAGKYQSVHDAMMAMTSLDDAGIAKALRQNGLDPATTVGSADDARHIQQVRDLAKAIGATGTPTYVVGDTMIAGNSMDQLALAIEQARHAKS